MIGNTDYKLGFVTAPGALVDNASLTTNVIDTLGFDRLEIIVLIGALDIAMTALKLQESDVAASSTALTGGADITGTVGGTDFTLPIATDDNKILVFDINLVNQARKRYLDMVATGGDGTVGAYITVIYRLSKAKNAADTDTLAGLLDRITI